MVIDVLFAILVIGCIAAAILRFVQNENSPVLTEEATLVKKIDDSSIDADGIPMDSFLLVFDINGAIIKCSVPNRVYKEAIVHTRGRLTHQGTRFYTFEFDGVRIEK